MMLILNGLGNLRMPTLRLLHDSTNKYLNLSNTQHKLDIPKHQIALLRNTFIILALLEAALFILIKLSLISFDSHFLLLWIEGSFAYKTLS